ncbi:SDR family NAD(P)-dependent oxidoreductase [Paraburkholderia sp. J12]|uniref:SDR family NAD(P)-dependent oxidoreductase n=1 Tax=Paraburkholderia sp. J12 TaxID=2805432 RepID=UPI002ABD66DF|nr:SDR family NAD(P)-dependent oxidoreductase [Paraburkholderia sp. J12]
MLIDGCTFFVAGGGSGLGSAVGAYLLARGANVVFADINEREPNGDLERALAVRTDVGDPASVDAAIGLAVSRFGALHGAINCAGIAPARRIVGRDGAHPLDLFAKVVSVNLIGTFNVMRLAAAAMTNNPPSASGERGVIVNTASIAAFDGQIGQAAYAASKGGVVSLTLPAARELASRAIRVVTVAPGLFETPMLLAMPDEVRRSLGDGVPFPERLGQPSEFASLVAHIVENTYLNGEVIRLDGALRMAPR